MGREKALSPNGALMSQTFEKSSGLTPSERFLAELCESTFLHLWSFPNLINGKGKELCDVLAVFGTDVIIFSDKDCAFPDSGDLELDWKRWRKKAIDSSVRQILGAERWLSDHPDRVFLDTKCEKPFPLAIPDAGSQRVHRVAVVRGAARRCRQELGGSGSLIINPTEPDEDPAGLLPFVVGEFGPNGEYVHVLDDVTLPILLKELDTAADLVAYLRKKEDFVASRHLTLCAREEELLARYLVNINDDGEHDFGIPPEVAIATIMEGFWEELEATPEYMAKKAADEISYAWDKLLNDTAKQVSSVKLDPRGAVDVETSERILRVLASESRFRRRHLAHALVDLITNSGLGENADQVWQVRYVASPPEGTERVYVFVVVDPVWGGDANRDIRSVVLENCCVRARNRFPKLREVFGIATSPASQTDGRTEDFMYFEGKDITDEMVTQAEQRRRDGTLGSVTPLGKQEFHGKEYPGAVEHRPARKVKASQRPTQTVKNRRKRERRRRRRRK